MAKPEPNAAPDSTAVRVSLRRAMHVQIDPPPRVLEDEIGLRLVAPFVSFFHPPEILAMAREVGFSRVRHVSADDLAQRYFAGRADGLRPPSNG